jgi:hypothetical protein
MHASSCVCVYVFVRGAYTNTQIAVMASGDSAKYNEKVDIYGYGLVVWGFATGEKPLEEILRKCMHTDDFANALMEGYRPDTDRILVSQLAALMSQCWQTDDAVSHTV